MYGVIPSHILFDHRLKPVHKLLVGNLTSRCRLMRRKYTVKVGTETLANDLQCSLRTVSRAIQKLEDCELVSVRRRANACNVYTLHLERSFDRHCERTQTRTQVSAIRVKAVVRKR
jgi:hypothetical protein